MLHERRSRQASQLGKKHRVCFVSKADGETFRAPLAAGGFDLGLVLQEESREEANVNFQFVKIFEFPGVKMHFGKVFSSSAVECAHKA